MHLFSKTRKINMHRNGLLKGIIYTAALGSCFSVGQNIADAKDKITKPVEGPELSGPIRAGRGTMEEGQAILVGKPDPDFAYGAFQRGYYLSALELALPRADAGDPAAQTLIAEIYWRGLGVALNRKKAATWYQFGARGGNSAAQFSYANILLQGKYVKSDKKAGRDFMEKAANSGHSRAQFNLAQIITAERPTWAGFKKALPWYEKAANAGLADAQYAMANIHAEAQGVTVNDDKKAREWLAKSAKNGFDSAQVEYGIWLSNGRGGSRDEKSALNWFKRAAAQKNIVAQNRLARMYYYGVGTKADIVKAGAWHVLARRAGFSDSQMDQHFSKLKDIDKRRAIELANRLSQ